MSTDAKPAAFPKFLDKEDDWKILVNDNKEGEKDLRKIVWYRIKERTRKKIDIEVKAVKRDRIVSRAIRSLLDENQHAFNIQNAGVTMFGGCLPLYKDSDSESPSYYSQGYRFTLRIV